MDTAALEKLLALTNLTVYQFSGGSHTGQSFLQFDDDGYPLFFVLPTWESELNIVETLHELGHFVDWPKMKNPMIQRAYQLCAHTFQTEAQWMAILTAEVRAWKNALLLAIANDLELDPESWGHFLLGDDSALGSYLSKWRQFHKLPTPMLHLWLKKLYALGEEASPGFSRIVERNRLLRPE